MTVAVHAPTRHGPDATPDAAAVLTKALLRAADLLGLRQAELARILGTSESTVSRMAAGRAALAASRTKEWELALLFVRLYRSLDAIVGAGEPARTWLRGENVALAGRPLDLIRSAEGLVRVVQYLDAHRGRL